MKKNSWFWYLAYGLILLFYFAGSDRLLTLLNKNSEASFNPIPFIIWSTVIFIILGVLLGLENLLLEARKEGKWRVNLPRVIFIGLPLLYFSLSFFDVVQIILTKNFYKLVQ